MIASEEVAKTILVTGGSGFLGKHVVSRLATDGFRIVSVDRRPISGEGHPSVSYILGDLQDAQLRAECFAKPLEAVVHLAASTSVIRSAESPAEFFENNVMVTQELLELCRINKVKGFVFASSAATTGEVGALPITPEFPVRPISPYAATKSACEALINAYGNSFAMNTANFTGANLTRANLASAGLGTVNFTNANLTGASVIAADMSGANLMNAKFINANLKGSRLLSVSNASTAKFKGAKCPDGLMFGKSGADCNLSF